MHEGEEIGWPEDRDPAVDEGSADDDSDSKIGSGTDEDGWQQYRRWISKAPAPRGRRSSLDPALYTWKGYRSWAKQVKRDWSGTDHDEN